MLRGKSFSWRRESRKSSSRIKVSNPEALVLLGALIPAAGWLWPYLAPLSLVGFVPLLHLADHFNSARVERATWKYWLHLMAAFLLWNILATWWIVNSSIGGAIAAFFFNSVFMTVPFLVFYYFLPRIKLGNALLAFICAWMGFEYLHMQWDLAWPWLNLGNTFAGTPFLVQWYKYLGAQGGSFWILWINVIAYRATTEPDDRWIRIAFGSVIALIPMVWSVWSYNQPLDLSGKKIEVAVVQPNIDPYKEKFSDSPSFISPEQQLDRLIRLSDKVITSNTKFVLWPETSLPVATNEDNVKYESLLIQLRAWLGRHKGLNLIAGGTTFKQYASKELATPSSRYSQTAGYYDFFNSALHIRDTGVVNIYHKSKLVPGVEKLPFPELLAGLAIQMGGTSGTLGTQKVRSVFPNNDGDKVGPIICYESVFGDFVADYVRRGAQFLGVVTNDGWWGNTPGHKQHLYFSSLRCIETGKWLARAANTGISCFVDPKGRILDPTEYWVQASLVGDLYLNDQDTLYVRTGDWLYLLCIGGLAGFLIYVMYPILNFRKTAGKN